MRMLDVFPSQKKATSQRTLLNWLQGISMILALMTMPMLSYGANGSCSGSCGGSGGGSPGCFCDNLCWDFGDCCPDVCAYCSTLSNADCSPGCGPTTFLANTATPPCGTTGTTTLGPGERVDLNVVTGATYTVSTCAGTSWDTEITGYTYGGGAYDDMFYDDDGCGTFAGPSTYTWTATFTGVLSVAVHRYQCQGYGTSGGVSAILSYTQVDNLSFNSSSAAMCPGQTRALSASPAGGTFSGTGVSATTFTAPTTPGSYTITYTLGACSETQSITVNNPGAAPTSITASATTWCPGDPNITLTRVGGALGTSGTWEWYTGSCGGTAAGSGNSITFTPATGNTTYYVRAENACGNTACASVTITGYTNSTAPTSISTNNNNFCPGQSATLTANGGTLGSGASVHWYTGPNGTGVSLGTGATKTVSPTVSSTYYARYEGTCNVTGDASINITVKVNSTAPSSINSSNGTIFCAPSANTNLSVQGGSLGTGGQWVWYRGSCGGTLEATGVSNISVNPGTTTTYYVRAEDDCGNTSCASITIQVSTGLSIDSIVSTDLLCYGDVNGQLDAYVSGGIPPYTYTWPSGPGTSNLSGLAGGTYGLTVGDAAGCSVSSTGTVNEPTQITMTVASSNVDCNGSLTGTITVNATGGTGQLFYSVDSGFTYVASNSFTALAAGDYYVYVQDINACVVEYGSNPITITQPPALSISGSAFDASCNGINDGTLVTNASGGTPPYGYSLNGGAPQPTGTFPGLGAGTYDVIANDANGCQDTVTLTINNATVLTLTIDSSNNVTCFNDGDGAFTVTADNGFPPYEYSLDGITYQSSGVFSGLDGGTYSVIARDQVGCNASTTITITEPALLTVAVDSVDAILCNGDSTGSIYVTATGGTPGTVLVPGPMVPSDSVTFALNLTTDNFGSETTWQLVHDGTGNTVGSGGPYAGATSYVENVTIASGENYTFTIFDAFGDGICCSWGTGSYFIDTGDGTTIPSPSGGTYAPLGTEESIAFTAATIMVPGPPTTATSYTFVWSNGDSTQNLMDVMAGTYTVTVTDTFGCTATTSYTLVQPAALYVTLADNSQVSCNGGSDGQLDISVVGGTPPYTYNWSDGQTTEDATGLTAGTYDVTVSDANGCDVEKSFTILEPSALTVAGDITNPTCLQNPDGGIDLTVTGGAGNSVVVTVTFVFDDFPEEVGWLIGDPVTGTLYAFNDFGTYAGLTGGDTVVTQVSVPADADLEFVTGDAFGDGICCSFGSGTYFFDPGDGSTIVSPTNGSYGGGETVPFTSASVTNPLPYSFLWSNGSTDEDQTNLGPGTYTVVVTDANGCTEVQSFTLDSTLLLNVSVASTIEPLCAGDSTGAIDLDVTGGIPTLGSVCPQSEIVFTITFDNFPEETSWQVTDTAGNILASTSAGDYASEPDGSTLTENICVPFGTVGTFTIFDAFGDGICCGFGNGSYSVTVDGNAIVTNSAFGTSSEATPFTSFSPSNPYTYAWSNGDTTQDLSGLPAGTYTVTVTSSTGCDETLTVTINEPDPVVASATSTNVACYGDSSGAIDLTVTGGNIGGGLAPADSVDVTITLTFDGFAEETSWELVDATTNFVYGMGGQTGAYDALDDSTITEVVTVPTNTSLNFNIADAFGDGMCCSFGSGTYEIDPGGGLATIPSPSGGAYGSSETVNFTSGAPLVSVPVLGYDYAWSTGDTTEDLSGLPAGTYTVTVTDVNGCSDDLTVTITQPDSIELQAVVTNVSCNGGSNGTINTTVTGGVAFYTYLWSTGATTADLNGLAAGTYTLTVTDQNGCTMVDSFTVTEPAALTVATTGTDALCNGSSDGTAVATASGGTSPYSYVWSSGTVGDTATGLAAGTYTVIATDANGCTASATYTVGEPAPLSTTVAITDAQCNGSSDGEITVTFAGGTAPYDYAWSNGPFATGASSSTNSGLAAGDYTITITDANGCTLSETYTVGEPDPLVVTGTVSNVACYGDSTGTIDITVTGGTTAYSYAWSDGQTTEDATGLPAGTYTVTVTDAHSCTATYTATVTQNDSLELQGSITNVKCNGGSDGAVYLTAIGGVPPYGYSWSNGAVTQNIVNVTAGTYGVTVTDGVGCSTVDSFEVTEPDSLLTSIAPTNVDCYGASTGAIDLTVTGGTAPYNFLWSNFATTEDLTNIPAGMYTVVVTDANGCITTDTVTITQNPEIVISGTVTNVTCYGAGDGTVTVSVTGGVPPYGYAWSNGDATATADSLTPGTYTVTVTDSVGCTATADYDITQPDSLDISAIITDVTCAGDSNGAVNVTVTGGTTPYTYTWSTGATTEDLSGLAGGVYTLTVADANGCTKVDSFEVIEPDTLMSTLTGNNVTCYGFANGSTDLTVTGGTPPYSYFWSNFRFTQNIYNLGPGQYFVIITDANGCNRVDSVWILEPDPLAITGSTKESGCVGESRGQIDITVTGGTVPYSYNWSTGDTTEDLAGLPAGTYTVTVTDFNGCQESATFVIEAFPQPAADFTANLACVGQETYFVNNSSIPDNSNLTYEWDFESDGVVDDTTTNPVHVFDATGSFNVSLVAISERGCRDTSVQTVFVNAVPESDIYALGDTVDLCTADSVELSVVDVSTNSYFWSTGDTTSSITVYQAGTYGVTVVNAVGCSTEDTIAVDIYSSSSVTISPDTTVSLGFAAQLTATGGESYEWSPTTGLDDPFSGTPLATPLENTTYSVTVTVRGGCYAVRNVTVNVVEDFLVIPPNIFSPNGDGIHDLWVIENIWTYPICKVSVFNRWGSEVFTTTGYQNDWDGTVDGKPVADGTYYYILQCSDRTYKGAVTILR